MQTLTPKSVHKTLKKFFPTKNDDFECDYAEELKELNDFGIATEEQFVDLLRKRVEEVMDIDRSPMDDSDIQFYCDELGAEFVTKRLREEFWFSYPGLLRIALELEFGESYKEYADKRDGVA